MRPISEATRAILKSQNLTNSDSFGYSIDIDGVEYFSPVQSINQITLASGAADFCYTIDSKILVAYTNGNKVYLSLVEDELELFSTDNYAATGAVLFKTLIGTGSFDNVKLSTLSNGKVLLTICEVSQSLAQCNIYVYKSESGLGTDFSLLGTPRSGLSSAGPGRSSISKIKETEAGALFFTAAISNYLNGYWMNSTEVFISFDSGSTWINKFSNPKISGGALSALGSCQIKNDYMNLLVGSTYNGGATEVVYSKNNGATWESRSKTYGFEGRFIIFEDSEFVFIGISGALFRRRKNTINSISDFLDFSKLELHFHQPTYYGEAHAHFISKTGTIMHLYYYYGDTIVDGYNRIKYASPVKVSSISINKGRGGANTASLIIDNKDGVANPNNASSQLYGVLNFNKRIIVKQGYGNEIIESFTGLIDSFKATTFPPVAEISMRDNLKKALDQTIEGAISFQNLSIEYIVSDLCVRAGLPIGLIEPTGIQVKKTFSWETYADCFQFLGDLASFEWGCDEYGKFYFKRDYQPADMVVSYTFEEGVDIVSLDYSIEDGDLYYKVVVFGKDSGGTIIRYEAPFWDAIKYNIMPKKILKIDATEAQTMGELQKIAERAIALMQSRTAVVKLTSIGIPWLQIGDFIGVYERSTGASSVYRISSINSQMSEDSYTMDIEAYYYGDSIVPGELPDTTATQTVAPSVNLIPEMTSNTVPSGKVRASSVYSAAYEPWQALNSSETDLYWNSITNTGWIEYEFPQKMIVDKYTVKARQSIEYNDAMPKNWTFEGFDGSQWVVLDTRINQTAWGVYEIRSYLFANTAAYSKYRLNVSRNNGYNRLQIEQLAMYYGGGA